MSSDFIDLLQRNKRTRGAMLEELIACVRALPDPNAIHGSMSLIGHTAATAFDQKQARVIVEALIARGAYPNERQITTQPHDKAISQACRRAHYDLAMWLAEQGAPLDDMVHAWLFRPKNKKEAQGLMAMEQLLWRHFDQEKKDQHLLGVMVHLVSCEIITGKTVSDEIVQEMTRMSIENAKKQADNNWAYTLSHIDGACRLFRDESKTLARLEKIMPRWVIAIHAGSENLPDQRGAVNYQPNIPADFWVSLPLMLASAHAQEIEVSTVPVLGGIKPRRI